MGLHRQALGSVNVDVGNLAACVTNMLEQALGLGRLPRLAR